MQSLPSAAVGPARGSWMLPGAADKSLLYASTRSTNVKVYDYASGELVGQLAGFNQAAGSCTDAQGNVYITNYGGGDIFKYSHGGTQPTVIEDPYALPIDCSVDPTTGNLAVVNQYGRVINRRGGNVVILPRGKGKPRVYKIPHGISYESAGYDDKGDLLACDYTGDPAYETFAIMEAGSSRFRLVNLQATYAFRGPSFIRWDGKYFVVEGQGLLGSLPTYFLMYTIAGKTGIKEGSLTLRGSGNYGGPFWVGRVDGDPKRRANRLVEVDYDGATFWIYPKGVSFMSIGGNDLYGGLTVSLK